MNNRALLSFGLVLIGLPLLNVPLVAAETATKKPTVTTKKTAPSRDLGPLFKYHWVERVKLFREENQKLTTKNNVILLGDSITEGFNVPKYFPDRHVLNRGIGADVVGNALRESDKRGILRRMDESIFDCSPAHVFLLIGINDIGMGHKPETIETGYRKILEEVKTQAPDVRLHVQLCCPHAAISPSTTRM